MSILLWYHLPENVADGFDNAASFHGATGNTRQQRSECKVIARGDHMNLIFGVVQVPQETRASPPSSQHHHLFLLRRRRRCFRCGSSLSVSYNPSTTASTKSLTDSHPHSLIVLCLTNHPNKIHCIVTAI